MNVLIGFVVILLLVALLAVLIYVPKLRAGRSDHRLQVQEEFGQAREQAAVADVARASAEEQAAAARRVTAEYEQKAIAAEREATERAQAAEQAHMTAEELRKRAGGI